MKRSLRDVLWLACIPALVLVLVQGVAVVRERLKPSPSIATGNAAAIQVISCNARPATAYSRWKGADMEFVARVQVASKICGRPQLRLSSSGVQSTNWLTTSKSEGQYTTSDVMRGLRSLSGKDQLKQVSGVLEVKDSCGSTPPFRKDFSLDTSLVYRPLLSEVRRENFRVVKVLAKSEAGGVGSPDVALYFEIQRQKAPFTDSRAHNVVGEWEWSQGSRKASAPTEWTTDFFYDAQAVRIKRTARQLPITAGTRLEGWISLESGWPQIISVTWPRFSNQNVPQEIPFSVRLAPALSRARGD